MKWKSKAFSYQLVLLSFSPFWTIFVDIVDLPNSPKRVLEKLSEHLNQFVFLLTNLCGITFREMQRKETQFMDFWVIIYEDHNVTRLLLHTISQGLF